MSAKIATISPLVLALEGQFIIISAADVAKTILGRTSPDGKAQRGWALVLARRGTWRQHIFEEFVRKEQ